MTSTVLPRLNNSRNEIDNELQRFTTAAYDVLAELPRAVVRQKICTADLLRRLRSRGQDNWASRLEPCHTLGDGGAAGSGDQV